MSSFEPLPRSRALEEPLPLTLLIRDGEFTAREFHMLARLVETTDCYRLYCGENVSTLPGLLALNRGRYRYRNRKG